MKPCEPLRGTIWTEAAFTSEILGESALPSFLKASVHSTSSKSAWTLTLQMALRAVAGSCQTHSSVPSGAFVEENFHFFMNLSEGMPSNSKEKGGSTPFLKWLEAHFPASGMPFSRV